VLDIREKTLEDKRLEMAKVIKLLNDLQDELNTMQAKYSSFKKELDGLLSSDTVNVSELAGYNDYLFQLEQDIKSKQMTIKNTKKVLLVKQADVNEALKDVKVLEKLKENQSKKFYDAIYKKEAEEIDDIVTARYKVQQV
jgi:flagellar FliJ protein